MRRTQQTAMGRAEDERRDKGEGSLFQSNGYWFYTYGYTIDGQQRKKKKCLGSVGKFRTREAAQREAQKFRNQFITDITTGKVMTSDVENVTCDQLLTQYIEHLIAYKKPAAYVIKKCIDAHVRPFFGPKRVTKLESRHFEQYRKMRVEEDQVSNATVDHDFTYLKSALLHEYIENPEPCLQGSAHPENRGGQRSKRVS
jgi:hypothetical protein